MSPRHLLALLALAASAACGSDDLSEGTPSPTLGATTPATAPATTAGGTVQEVRALSGNRWSVGTLTLKVGDSVKVTDDDQDIPHNFVVEGVGRSPTMNAGDTFTLRFDKAGTFEFVCTFHDGMEGTVTVS